MPNTVEEVERTEALLRDAVRLLTEPATSYSRAAAAAVVVESLRLYRRALERQRAARRARGGTQREPRHSFHWRGSLAELADAGASSDRAPAPLSVRGPGLLN
jgi:hypothetical protein